MQTDYTLYKLIVLFMLNRIDFPITNAQITDFILEKEYTNYFVIQQALAELVEAEFISCELARTSTKYKITDAGRETLGFFEGKISDAIKEDIINFLGTNEYAMKDKNSAIAYYIKSDNETDYIVNLSIKEDKSSLIEVSLTVPSEDIAVKMCSNWQEKSPDIYSYIFKSLQ